VAPAPRVDCGHRSDIAVVGELNGELGGLAWGRIEESSPNVASLHQMWVAPSVRRRGVGPLTLSGGCRLDLGPCEAKRTHSSDTLLAECDGCTRAHDEIGGAIQWSGGT
jgi:hypothetical protein